MKIIEKLFNKLGYYKPASGKYYKSFENNKPIVVDEKLFKETHQYNYDAVKEAARLMLIAQGEDIQRPGLLETPRRIAGFWQELLEGEKYTNQEIAEKYKKQFIVPSDSIVVLEVRNVYSICEHHEVLMYNGTCYVAYVPKKQDDGYVVIGLSKIPRIVHTCSKRLQLQEKLASDIAECIELATGSDQVYVQLIMDHGCVSARGIKADSTTDVTYMSEKLKKNKEARKEIEVKIQNMYK